MDSKAILPVIFGILILGVIGTLDTQTAFAIEYSPPITINLPNSESPNFKHSVANENGLFVIWEESIEDEIRELKFASFDGQTILVSPKTIVAIDLTSLLPNLRVVDFSANGLTLDLIYHETNSIHTLSQVKHMRSTDGGATWNETPHLITAEIVGSMAVNVSENTISILWENDGSGRIVDPRGELHDSEYEFTKSIDGGVTWSIPVQVSGVTDLTYSGDSTPENMIIDGNNIYVIYVAYDEVWQDVEGSKIYFAKSTDGGITFSTPIPVVAGHQIYSQILFLDPNNPTNLTLIFNGRDDSPLKQIRSLDSGITWTNEEEFVAESTGCSINFHKNNLIQEGSSLFYICDTNANTVLNLGISNNLGLSWNFKEIVNLTAGEIDHYQVDANQDTFVVLFENKELVENEQLMFMESLDRGETFESPTILHIAPEVEQEDVKIAPNGNAYAIYVDEFDSENGINTLKFITGNFPPSLPPSEPPTDCIFCLSDEQKALFEEMALAFDEFGDATILSLPFDLASLPESWTVCQLFSDVDPRFCIPFVINVALLVGPDVGQIGAQAIADDPPDSNFETVFPIPSYEIIDTGITGDAGILLEELANSFVKQNALQQAFLVTLERYQGALIADEPEFVKLQLTALQEYTNLLIENQIELTNISSDYSLILPDLISDEELIPLQERLIDDGYTQDEIELFLDLGYNEDQISIIKESIIDFETDDLIHKSSVYDDLAESISPLTVELETYSNNIEEFLAETILAPRIIKENALHTLEELLEEDLDKKTKKDLEKAIKSLQKSLDDSLWVDDYHLIKDNGVKVFKEEKKAVKKLMNIVKKDKETPEVNSKISNVISSLVEADSQLVIIAIEEAQEKLDNDKPHKAIEYYKKAWIHAQKALSHVDDDDEEEDEDD